MTDPGRDFEERFAGMIGGEVVRGSGSGRFAKGDVRGGPLVFSCKHTRRNSFSVTAPMLHEARQIGRAEGASYGMAVECGGEAYVVMPVGEWLEAVNASAPVIARDQARAKREAALTPPRMRDA